MSAPLYCSACEAAAVDSVALGFIDDAGRVGEIDGFACASCRRIWEAPGAVPMITGRVALGGRPALEVVLERLERLGCDPRPITEP